jgi:Fic family protein
MAFARAVQGSNSIEGYEASLDDVVAAVEGEPTFDANQETQLALIGYRDAMTYVLQISDDPDLQIDSGLIKSLHFMMMSHRLDKNPGRWRPGDVFVQDESSGDIVYEGPDSSLVPSLINEFTQNLGDSHENVLVRGAMAHLNLVMIHPFSDGNGRMARCLQTLVLSREQIVAPVFSSIEEFLGRNTRAYYDVLAEVGEGAWHPGRDARPWVRFCLRAHYLQARTTLRRRKEIESLWNACWELAESRGLPERTVAGIMEAAYGFRLTRSVYQRLVAESFGEELKDLTASRDLRLMVDAQVVDPVGERRGRYYLPAAELSKLRAAIRSSRPPRASEDPFEVVQDRNQLKLIEE